MLEIDGQLEALRCSGLAEKIVFDKVPEGLSDVPTLSVQVDMPVAGRYNLTLSYLATAVGWASDYVAHIHPERGTLDLSGWITLANFTETSFKRVPVQFVAGAVNTTGDDAPVSMRPLTIATSCWPQQKKVTAAGQQEFKFGKSMEPGGETAETVVVTGSRIPDPRLLGDYKVYTLPEPTSVNALQIKQIQFLDQHEVPFKRIYSYLADNDYRNEKMVGDTASVSIRLQNRADQGLGKPLPAAESL